VLRRQVAQAHAAIAELYITDLCDLPGAEEFCEANIQRAIDTDELCLDAYHSLANLRLIRGRFAEVHTALSKINIILPNLGENFLPTSETFGEIIRLMVEVEDFADAVTV
jgi:hypothetical protein